MRTVLLRLAALTTLVATSAVGCTGSSGDGDDATPERTTTTAFPTPAGPEVTGTGEAPRTELRLALTEGTTTAVTHTTDLAVIQAGEGTTRTLDPPPVAQTLAFTVGAVDDDGADVTFAVTGVEVRAEGTTTSPEAALLLTGELAALEGLVGTGHLSTRGHLERIAFDVPEAVDPTVAAQVEALTDQLGALAPTLPEEAVGIGATWEARTTSTIGGVATDQVTTYTLTGVTDGGLTFTSTTAYATEPQDVTLDGLPAGTTARLVSSDLAGTAEGTMDLSSPAHTLAATATGGQVIEVDDGAAEPTTLTQRIDLTTTITPAP